MKKSAIIVAAAGLALATSAQAQIEWAAPVDGSWGVAANWNPVNIPDLATELAVIGVSPGPYTVTIDLLSPPLTTIGGLMLLNSDATLDILGRKTLSVAGPALTINGLIRINSNGSTADGVLQFDANTSITGTGIIRLNRNNDARLETGVGFVVSNDATINGGGLLNAALENSGLVEATGSGILTLRVNDKSNTGTMRAGAASTLAIDDITVTQSGAGVIEAVDGTVSFTAGIHSVLGGRFDTSGAGKIDIENSSDLTVDAITNDGLVNIKGGGDLFVDNGITNNGTIVVDSNNSTADGNLFFNQSGSIDGTGTVRLIRNNDAVINAAVGAVVTNSATQTIIGGGQIHASVINNGLIDADLAGAIINLRTQDKTNNALIVAHTDATILLNQITMTQSPGGILRADGGTMLAGTGILEVDGGTVEAVNGGLFTTAISTSLSLVDVDLVGPFDIVGASTVTMSNSLTNNGTITIDSTNSAADGVLTTATDITIDGTGVIRLNRNIDARLETAPATTLTIGANQVVTGGGKLAADLVNNGLVDAETTGGIMVFAGNDKVNNTLMRARNGGTLDLSGVTTTQAPAAQILADGGTILVTSAGPARIDNGSLDTLNAGLVTVNTSASLTLGSVDFTGDMEIRGAGSLTIDGTLANNGTIVIDSNNSAADGVLTTIGDASITGTGTLRLNRGTDARITTPDGFTLTLGGGQSVTGLGDIEAALVNNGTIDADVVGGILALEINDKINNGSMTASAGVLELRGLTIDQTGGGSMLATDGGLIGVVNVAPGTRIEGGTLTTANGSIVSVSTSASLTLMDVVFAGQMDLFGAGTLNAEGTVINNGLIFVNSNSSAADALVVLADSAILGGTGEIRLGRAGPDARLSTPGSATLSAGQTVTGSGTIAGTWAFNGAIAPGLSVGTITDTGSINMGSTASIDIELVSTASFDKINGPGAIDLDGALNIAFDGYTPVKNDVFRFIDGPAVTGQFAAVNGPALSGGLVYGLFYDPAFVELRITCGPDLNLDGLLDFFDVQFFLQAFAAGDPVGDFNGDGLFDFFDVLAFLDAFSAGCP